MKIFTKKYLIYLYTYITMNLSTLKNKKKSTFHESLNSRQTI